MMTWFKLALRNLWRNGRRSLFTILAIGMGFLAVNTLGGFTQYIFQSLKDSYIYAESNGHLTVFKQGFLLHGKLEPTRYLLSESDVKKMRAILARHPEVLVVTPQLQISGLLSNGKVSTIFFAPGRVPGDIQAIASHAVGVMGRARLYDGKPLSDGLDYGIGITHGLSQQLNLKLGTGAVAMSPTISGQINALDAQIVQLIDAPDEALENSFATVPLKFAQSLYDTTDVDRLTILLRDDTRTLAVRDELEREFGAAGLAVDVKTWNELSPFYTKVKKMFDVIFLITFLIVFTIVVMSIVNTVTMAIMERTREIGTLRALGVRRRGIVGLFALESLMLGVFGALLGAVLNLGVLWAVAWFQPTWVPPQISREVPLQIYFVPEYWIYSILALLCLSLVASLMPARKAARMVIVNALGYA
ncbi:putative ABC transport system permease protein [Paraburkholderia eburnea]|uniref:Putative ABC transport system permease protein n=1 Tax=Paraburkholderia eburnea TaxID=1189126 RepID=A0A2S4MAG1_9BURK|nr:FtsX-like permease family protein [Paraburkholderia eburnea]POR51599.1 putative ABC transport system permease protein [Paraburkholderia eburnea]PRZ22630.1 putative ABC transport system permease protein [Paraburkholderia eburnea]